MRDGEQTSGVSFNAPEKLNIAKILLCEVKVDRIEIASARVSEGEFEAVQKIMEWADQNNLSERIEILGFIDKNASLDWIEDAGARVVEPACQRFFATRKGTTAQNTGGAPGRPGLHYRVCHLKRHNL